MLFMPGNTQLCRFQYWDAIKNYAWLAGYINLAMDPIEAGNILNYINQLKLSHLAFFY